MTAKERAEHLRLCKLWARQRATVKQIHRCMALSRRLENERQRTVTVGSIEPMDMVITEDQQGELIRMDGPFLPESSPIGDSNGQ